MTIRACFRLLPSPCRPRLAKVKQVQLSGELCCEPGQNFVVVVQPSSSAGLPAVDDHMQLTVKIATAKEHYDMHLVHWHSTM